MYALGEKAFCEISAKTFTAACDEMIPHPLEVAGFDNFAVGELEASDSEILARMRSIGYSEIEQTICQSQAFGNLDDLQVRDPNAWNASFPGLPLLAQADRADRRLRICIATEDIVGPVRNGGIGTTYAQLAELLAADGIDTTILYLCGHDLENGTIEEWVDHYAQLGVCFTPVPNYAAMDRLHNGVSALVRTSYNMMRYLLDNPMDVVHVSEWRASGYLSLMAKRQGLTFANTLFVVKASSPWLWSRLYGSQPVDRPNDLTRIYAERQSIELADMVIGGSTHLLRWMSTQGYKLPEDRTFVQPNVLFLDHLSELAEKRKSLRGTRIPIEEIVFFGRLETRKGLFIFCEAIKRLIRQGVTLPRRITFMGKPGVRLTARPDEDVIDYVKAETASWPCEIRLLTELHQAEALTYLLSARRLAVMPSVVENSSLAVYEATLFGVPFIASNAGGTPELVAEQDKATVLCPAHPIPLSDKIAEMLTLGGYISTPSFDNVANLEKWRRFHSDLGRGLFEELLDKARPASKEHEHTSLAVCIYHPFASEALDRTLASLQNQDVKPDEVLIGVDTEIYDATLLLRLTKTYDFPFRLIDCSSFDAGLAFNVLAQNTNARHLLFTWSGIALNDRAIDVLARTAQASRADVLNFFHRVVQSDGAGAEYLSAFIIGSVSEAFFRADLSPMPILVRAAAFAKAGGFSTDYRVLGCEQEFVARCQVQGFACTTVLMDMGTVLPWDPLWLKQRCYDEHVSYFRAIRPQIAAAPLALRDLLLLAKGLQARVVTNKPVSLATGRKWPSLRRGIANATFNRLFGLLIANAAGKGASSPPFGVLPSAEKSFDTESALSGQSRNAYKSVTTTRRQRSMYRLGNVGADSFSGRLLAVNGSNLIGWLCNENRMDDAIAIDLFIDDRFAQTVSADLKLPALSAGPLDGHVFWCKLRKSNWLRQKLRILTKVTLKVAGTDILLAETRIGHRSLSDAGFEGHCDIVAPGVINGWAMKSDEPYRVAEVAAFVDGVFLSRVPCARERNDVHAAGKGHGNYGFSITIPKHLRDGKRRTVEVVLADYGILVPRGRILLKGSELTFK